MANASAAGEWSRDLPGDKWGARPRREPSRAPWVALGAVDEGGGSSGAERGDEDDLEVRLPWPSEVVDEPSSALRPLRPARPEREPVPEKRSTARPPAVSESGAGTVLPKVAAEVHAVHETVTELLAQVELVATATKALRRLVSDRLGEVSESIDQLSTTDLSGTERALHDLGVKVDEVRAAITSSAASPTSEEPGTAAVLEEVAAARDATAASLDAFGADLVNELAEVLAKSRAEAAASLDRVRGEFAEELATMRHELTSLKRRIPVRARGSAEGLNAEERADRVGAQLGTRLTDDEVQRVASAVARHLMEEFEVGDSEASSSPPTSSSRAPRKQQRARSRSR